MRQIPFTKMQGLGNDFVVLDGVRNTLALSTADYRAIADRHFGIGCDQLLLVEPAQDSANDFRYRIFNADGGEVEQCGNGARCFARFVYDQGLTQKTQLRVETLKGVITPTLHADGLVTVDMGLPRFVPAQIPFAAPEEALSYPLEVLDAEGQAGQATISVVNMGNPHAVLLVDDVATASVALLGPQIESHQRFPERVNAGFMQVQNRQQIALRVYERGAGETLACGTGACAAVVAGIRLGLLDSKVTVQTRGGALTIEWLGDAVSMTGPAETVFSGVYYFAA